MVVTSSRSFLLWRQYEAPKSLRQHTDFITQNADLSVSCSLSVQLLVMEHPIDVRARSGERTTSFGLHQGWLDSIATLAWTATIDR